jgi:hypothetical protein
MDHNESSSKHEQTDRREPKDLRQANENIRKSEGDQMEPPAAGKGKSGNRPAFDRDR